MGTNKGIATVWLLIQCLTSMVYPTLIPPIRHREVAVPFTRISIFSVRWIIHRYVCTSSDYTGSTQGGECQYRSSRVYYGLTHRQISASGTLRQEEV